MRNILFTALTICCIFVNIHSAAAWGEKGHNATARVAQRHLSCRAERKVTELLDGRNMAYWSAWPDAIRSRAEFRFTSPWHYANADEGFTYSTAPKAKGGDVYTAVEECIRVLSDRAQTDSVKSVYLKFLIHFVGDLHCPMHAGHASDKGGNGYAVEFRGRKTNLHSLWDSQILDGAHSSWSSSEWAENVDYKMTRRERRELAAGTPLEWMEQTVVLSDSLYKGTPQDENLGWDYINTFSPLVEEQILEGGLRLAKILNELF